MSRWHSRIVATALLAGLVLTSPSARGDDLGGVCLPSWWGAGFFPYQINNVPTPPYFALHPPVYYGVRGLRLTEESQPVREVPASDEAGPRGVMIENPFFDASQPPAAVRSAVPPPEPQPPAVLPGKPTVPAPPVVEPLPTPPATPKTSVPPPATPVVPQPKVVPPAASIPAVPAKPAVPAPPVAQPVPAPPSPPAPSPKPAAPTVPAPPKVSQGQMIVNPYVVEQQVSKPAEILVAR